MSKSTTPQATNRPTAQQQEKQILHLTNEQLYERVARKAYELYQQRGEDPGHALEDWVTAERLVRAELQHGPLGEELAPAEDDTP
jgi:hypothetical protein